MSTTEYNREWRRRNPEKAKASQRRSSLTLRAKYPERSVWAGMIIRCYSKNSKAYSYYGARGIRVCPQWRHNFKQFLADVGRRPHCGLTIERINNDGDYEPNNVRWATQKEQARNTRSNVWITIGDQTDLLFDWSKRFNIDQSAVRMRIKRGIAAIDAFYMGRKCIKWYGAKLIPDGNPLAIPCSELLADLPQWMAKEISQRFGVKLDGEPR